MKKLTKVLLFVLLLAMSVTCFACGNTGSKEPETLYNIQFVNGTEVLQTLELKAGQLPEYTGETPVKASTEQYTYTFNGWNTDIVEVTGDATYMADFTQAVRKYTITFIKDGGSIKNGTEEIDNLSVDYGTPATALSGLVATKENSSFVKFQIQAGETFVDIEETATITSDVTIKAIFLQEYATLTLSVSLTVDGEQVTGDKLTPYETAIQTALAEKTSYYEGDEVDITTSVENALPGYITVDKDNSTLKANVTNGAVSYTIKCTSAQTIDLIGSSAIFAKYFTTSAGSVPTWKNYVNYDNSDKSVVLARTQGYDYIYGLHFNKDALQELFDDGYTQLTVVFHLSYVNPAPTIGNSRLAIVYNYVDTNHYSKLVEQSNGKTIDEDTTYSVTISQVTIDGDLTISQYTPGITTDITSLTLSKPAA